MSQSRMIIGVPRGMFFYLFFDLAAPFFEELGAELVPSAETNGAIFEDGLRYCVDDACIPVKSFHGHTAYLADKADLLLIPRMVSISRKEYICPKIAALPDMVRSMPVKLPRVIDTEMDLYRNGRGLHKAFFKMAVEAGLSRDAAFMASIKLRSMIGRNISVSASVSASEAVPEAAYENISGCDAGGCNAKIGIIGHSYTLSDSFLNMNLLRKIRQNGMQPVIMPEYRDMGCHACIKTAAGCREQKRIFWYFGISALDALKAFLGMQHVEGVIYVTSFGCGIDSFITFIVERHLKNVGGIPFMSLVLDEHSGEAGLDTRIEAFADLIAYNRRQTAGRTGSSAGGTGDRLWY